MTPEQAKAARKAQSGNPKHTAALLATIALPGGKWLLPNGKSTTQAGKAVAAWISALPQVGRPKLALKIRVAGRLTPEAAAVLARLPQGSKWAIVSTLLVEHAKSTGV